MITVDNFLHSCVSLRKTGIVGFCKHQMDIISRWYGGPPWQQALRFRRGYPSASKERPAVEKRGRGRKWREVKQGGVKKLCIPRFSGDVKVEFVVILIAMIKFSTDKTTIDTFYDYFLTDD